MLEGRTGMLRVGVNTCSGISFGECVPEERGTGRFLQTLEPKVSLRLFYPHVMCIPILDESLICIK